LDPSALPPVRDQGQQGSCTGHGTTGALMWSYKAKRNAAVQLSPAFAYFQARVIEASVKEDAGAEIRDVIKAAAKFGVSLEQYAPYNPNKLTTSVSARAMNNATSHQVGLGYYRCDDPKGGDRTKTVDNMLRALNAKMGIVDGFSWFSCLDTAEVDNTGVMPVPTAKDRLEGGHCTWTCYADIPSRVFVKQGSYGNKYGGKHPVTGERGYHIMPFDYVIKGICDDIWAITHE
jgi:hypothetical protein